MTEGRPWKCILRFALPLFFGSLLQQMYYTVDAMMVGHLAGEQALSGVGTCAVLTNLLIAFSVGFSAGSSIISAQYFGAKQYQGIAKNALASMLSLIVLGLCIGGLSIGFGRPMLHYLVSVPDSLLDYQGIGKGMISTALSSAFLTICLIFAYTLQYVPAIGYRSLFICKPMSWAIISAVNYMYYFKGKWETASAIKMNQEG